MCFTNIFLYICYFKLRRSELSCYNFVYSILITIQTQGKLWTYNHCYFTSIIRKFLYQWKERIWGRGQVAVRMDGFRTSPCTRIRDPQCYRLTEIARQLLRLTNIVCFTNFDIFDRKVVLRVSWVRSRPASLCLFDKSVKVNR